MVTIYNNFYKKTLSLIVNAMALAQSNLFKIRRLPRILKDARNEKIVKMDFNYKTIFTFPIIFYKKIISPILPNSCRFYPTCSEYTVLAINKYGVLRGIAKGFIRILRCNPFSKGGIDFP